MRRAGPRLASLAVVVALGLLGVSCSSSAGVRTVDVGVGVGTVPGQSGSSTTIPTSATIPRSTTVPGSSNPGSSNPGSTTPGSGSSVPDTGTGIGDALFPSLGNPGVDVTSYDVHLTVDEKSHRLTGHVDLEVTFTQARSEFTLDSDGPVVSKVTIDGARATFHSERPELHIDLPTPVRIGDDRLVSVTYSVEPESNHDIMGVPVGFFFTPGGSWAQNEPDGARRWLPSDDHPSDKANFTFSITVPKGVTAVANGALVDHQTVGGTDVWSWNEPHPMATYLIQFLTGSYDLIDTSGPHGMPLVSVVLHDDRAHLQPFIDAMPAEISYFEQYFGPYPFTQYGLAITDSVPGIAVETQERSLFSRNDFTGGRLDNGTEMLLSHELVHQWFGDAVSPARWRDVWLNESFATYGQWMWLEHAGYQKLADEANSALANRQPGSTADPTVETMFGNNSYDGGAVVLHALRLTIGDDAFFRLLRQWVADNFGESRTTQDFIALAEKVSGRDLKDFFDTWLFAATLPTKFPSPAPAV